MAHHKGVFFDTLSMNNLCLVMDGSENVPPVKRKRGRPPKALSLTNKITTTLNIEVNTSPLKLRIPQAETNSNNLLKRGAPDFFTPLMRVLPSLRKRKRKSSTSSITTPIEQSPMGFRPTPPLGSYPTPSKTEPLGLPIGLAYVATPLQGAPNHQHIHQIQSLSLSSPQQWNLMPLAPVDKRDQFGGSLEPLLSRSCYPPLPRGNVAPFCQSQLELFPSEQLMVKRTALLGVRNQAIENYSAYKARRVNEDIEADVDVSKNGPSLPSRNLDSTLVVLDTVRYQINRSNSEFYGSRACSEPQDHFSAQLKSVDTVGDQKSNPVLELGISAGSDSVEEDGCQSKRELGASEEPETCIESVKSTPTLSKTKASLNNDFLFKLTVDGLGKALLADFLDSLLGARTSNVDHKKLRTSHNNEFTIRSPDVNDSSISNHKEATRNHLAAPMTMNSPVQMRVPQLRRANSEAVAPTHASALPIGSTNFSMDDTSLPSHATLPLGVMPQTPNGREYMFSRFTPSLPGFANTLSLTPQFNTLMNSMLASPKRLVDPYDDSGFASTIKEEDDIPPPVSKKKEETIQTLEGGDARLALKRMIYDKND